jgi:hypothetical protein
MGLYNDDVLFIHIPKTAGYSVKNWLLEVLPGAKMPKLGGFDLEPEQIDSRMPIGHIPLKDIQRYTGRKPESFKMILGIVRDPYEHQLSQWAFWRDRYAQGGRHVHDIIAASYPTLTGWLLDPRCDFHIWYESVHGEQANYRLNTKFGFGGYPNYGGYYRYWLSVDGRIPPNTRLVKMEELSEALPEALNGFIEGEAEIPHRNVSSHPGLTANYYTPLGCRIVEQKFQWVFDLLLYQRWDLALTDETRTIA